MPSDIICQVFLSAKSLMHYFRLVKTAESQCEIFYKHTEQKRDKNRANASPLGPWRDIRLVCCTTLLVSYCRLHPVERIHNSDSMDLFISTLPLLLFLQNPTLPESNRMPVGVMKMSCKHLYLYADADNLNLAHTNSIEDKNDLCHFQLQMPNQHSVNQTGIMRPTEGTN